MLDVLFSVRPDTQDSLLGLSFGVFILIVSLDAIRVVLDLDCTYEMGGP